MSHSRQLRIRLNVEGNPDDTKLFFPSADLVWVGCQFEINPTRDTEADFSIVLWNGRPYDRFICAPNNTLLIVGEPISKKLYPEKYYSQFGHLVDTHHESKHPNVHISAPGLEWHVGRQLGDGRYSYGYSKLKSLPCPEKQNRISVVCSDLKVTAGQRQRLEFLDYLKEHLGDQLVHYGRGFKSIQDKMDAILPYRYHLVLENSCEPHYWTEKLADAYLGWAYPLYVGCPNIKEYFSDNAFTALDMDDKAGALALIRQALELPDEQQKEQMGAVSIARDLILDRYNPIAWAGFWAKKLYRDEPKKQVVIRSHRAYRPAPFNYWYRFRKYFSGDN